MSKTVQLRILTKALALLLAGFALAGLSVISSKERPAEHTKSHQVSVNK